MLQSIHFKIAARSIGKAALWHLSKPDTYLAAGALGLGAGLASKKGEKVSTGIQTGLFAVLGMVSFTTMHLAIPIEVDKAIEKGEVTLEE